MTTKAKKAVANLSVWFTLEEAAPYIGMTVRFMQKRYVDGTIPHYKFGGSIRFRQEDLDEYIAGQRRVGYEFAREKASR